MLVSARVASTVRFALWWRLTTDRFRRDFSFNGEAVRWEQRPVRAGAEHSLPVSGWYSIGDAGPLRDSRWWIKVPRDATQQWG